LRGLRVGIIVNVGTRNWGTYPQRSLRRNSYLNLELTKPLQFQTELREILFVA
jgi:hypothetical protein